MRKLILLPILVLCACSTPSTHVVSDEMQPDSSYRIITLDSNQSSASTERFENLKREGATRAEALCPGGYDKKAQFAEKLENGDIRGHLIVKCH